MLEKSLLQRVVQVDRNLTLSLNRLVRWRTLRTFFSLISSLGNGRLWYTLMLILPVFQGYKGFQAALHLALTGLVTLITYRIVKGATQRPRPGAVYDAIEQGAHALDEYSFPSGHTMHAVVFTSVACAWFPGLFLILGTFTMLTAVSRVVLGLHYPTDVLLGAGFGLLIGSMSLAIVF